MSQHQTQENQGDQISVPSPEKTQRPFPIVFLAAVFLVVGVRQLVRFILILQHWDMLSFLSLAVPPEALAAVSFGEAAVELLFVWGVWSNHPWSKRVGLSACLLVVVRSWGELLLSADLLRLQTRWPFQLLVTILFLGLMVVLFQHPASKTYFENQS